MPNSHTVWVIYLSFLANSMSYIYSDKLSTRRELQEIDTQFVCFSQKFYFYLYRLLSTRCHYITYLGKWQYQLYIYIASTQQAKQNILAIANVVLIIKQRYMAEAKIGNRESRWSLQGSCYWWNQRNRVLSLPNTLFFLLLFLAWNAFLLKS